MENKRFKFNKAALIDLEYPGKLVDYRDTEAKYLALRVAKKSKTFYYVRKIDGRVPYIKLGRFPDMPIAAARKAHDQLSGQIAGGEPIAVQPRRSKAPRLADIYETYMNEHMRPKRKSAEQDETRYRLYLSQWANKRADRITPAMVNKLHLHIGTELTFPVMANKTIEQLRRIYNYAARSIPNLANPTLQVTKYKEHRRKRYLRANELQALFAAIQDERMDDLKQYEVIDVSELKGYRSRGPANPIILDCIETLLWTGQRKMTVATMLVDAVDLAEGIWRLPVDVTKAGEEQLVILGPAAEIIRRRIAENPQGCEYVFPGRYGKGHIKELRYSWQTVTDRAGLHDVTIHDLRRTLGSWLAATGGNLRAIQDILGHSSMQATRIYTELDTGPLAAAHAKATAAILDAIHPPPEPHN